MDDGLERRWKLFFGAILFYAFAIGGTIIFIHVCEYPNTSWVDAEEIIRKIHSKLFSFRYLFYLLLSIVASPWIINRGDMEISQFSSHNKEGKKRLFWIYIILVLVIGSLTVYVLLPRYITINWGHGIEFSAGDWIIEHSVIEHLWLILSVSVLTLTLFQMIFGVYLRRRNAKEESLLIAGASLMALMLLLVSLNHNFSFVWAVCVLLSLPTTLLFVWIVIKSVKKEVAWYVAALSFVFLIGGVLCLLFWAQINKYSVVWLLMILIFLLGVIILITLAVISRDTTRVKEIIENTLKSAPDIDLPRVRLKLIRKPQISAGWAVVNIIIETLSTIAVTITNTISHFGYFLINKIVMPLLEKFLYILLWLLTQIFNLLLILFMHLAFAFIVLPKSLGEVITIILDALEISCRLVYFQIVTLIAFSCSVAASVYFATDYFLVSDVWLATGILGAGLVNIFSIVFSISLLFRVSFIKVFNFYMRNLSELLSYFILLTSFACWLLIFICPKFGIEHFKAGLVTWLSTAVLIIAIPLAYIFRDKSGQQNP